VLAAGEAIGAAWLALAGARGGAASTKRSRPLLGYIAIALFKHFVEGLSDPRV
jgi:hypothetical protein